MLAHIPSSSLRAVTVQIFTPAYPFLYPPTHQNSLALISRLAISSIKALPIIYFSWNSEYYWYQPFSVLPNSTKGFSSHLPTWFHPTINTLSCFLAIEKENTTKEKKDSHFDFATENKSVKILSDKLLDRGIGNIYQVCWKLSTFWNCLYLLISVYVHYIKVCYIVISLFLTNIYYLSKNFF